MEDSSGVRPDLPIPLRKIVAIGDQAASRCELASHIDRWDRITLRKRDEIIAMPAGRGGMQVCLSGPEHADVPPQRFCIATTTSIPYRFNSTAAGHPAAPLPSTRASQT